MAGFETRVCRMFAAMWDAAGWDRVSAADEVGVESYIRQLTALDADSFSFRYAGFRKGGFHICWS